MPDHDSTQPHGSQPSPQSPALEPGSATPIHIVGVVLVIAAVGGVAFLGLHRRSAEASEANERQHALSEGPVVRVVPVERAPSERTLSLPGEVHAFKQVTLYAKIAGFVKTLTVDKGDPVKKGQLLATLEAPELEHQIAGAQADRALKQTMARRDSNLVGQRVVSEQEMDSATAALQVSESTVKTLEAQRDYAEIRAPFDGVVTARYVDPGMLIPAATGSTQAALPVVDVSTLDRLRIYVYVGQQDAPLIHEGDPAVLTVDGVARPPIHSPVSRVTHALDPRTRTMLVEVDVQGEGGVLPGSFVHLSLTLHSPPMPLIPIEALLVENGRTSVATVKDRRVHFVPIVTGIDDGKRVQVLEGLVGDEQVALNLSSSVGDGQQIQIAPSTPAPK